MEKKIIVSFLKKVSVNDEMNKMYQLLTSCSSLDSIIREVFPFFEKIIENNENFVTALSFFINLCKFYF